MCQLDYVSLPSNVRDRGTAALVKEREREREIFWFTSIQGLGMCLSLYANKTKPDCAPRFRRPIPSLSPLSHLFFNHPLMPFFGFGLEIHNVVVPCCVLTDIKEFLIHKYQSVLNFLC